MSERYSKNVVRAAVLDQWICCCDYGVADHKEMRLMHNKQIEFALASRFEARSSPRVTARVDSIALGRAGPRSGRNLTFGVSAEGLRSHF